MADTTAYGESSVSASKAPAPKPSKVERIEIEPSKNGGFIARCYKVQRGNRSMMIGSSRPDTHTFADIDGLKGYLDESFGGGAPAVEPAPPEPIAPPVPAAPAADVAEVAAGPVDSGDDVEDDGAYSEDDE